MRVKHLIFGGKDRIGIDHELLSFWGFIGADHHIRLAVFHHQKRAFHRGFRKFNGDADSFGDFGNGIEINA